MFASVRSEGISRKIIHHFVGFTRRRSSVAIKDFKCGIWQGRNYRTLSVPLETTQTAYQENELANGHVRRLCTGVW